MKLLLSSSRLGPETFADLHVPPEADPESLLVYLGGAVSSREYSSRRESHSDEVLAVLAAPQRPIPVLALPYPSPALPGRQDDAWGVRCGWGRRLYRRTRRLPGEHSSSPEGHPMKHLPRYVLVLGLVLAACESTNGVPFGATAEGRISTRAVHPFPALSTFAVYAPEVFPSIETADVTACLQRHLQSYGGRLVSLDENPEAVVLFQFETDAAPASYRRNTFDSSTFHARWTRRFSLRLLDGSTEGGPRVLWQAEITSAGSSSSLGPLAYTFLDQAFQRFGRSVSGESFLVLANRTCAAAPLP